MKKPVRYLMMLCFSIIYGCAVTLPGIVNEDVRISRVKEKAAWDLDCKAGMLRLTKLSRSTYGVKGCGKMARYELFKCESHATGGQWASGCRAVLTSKITPMMRTQYNYLMPKHEKDDSGNGDAAAHYERYDRDIRDFTMAIETNPRDAQAYNGRGLAYLNKGQYDKAISDFSSAIEINPGISGPYNNRGLAYFGKSYYETAIDDFSKAIEISPDLVQAYSSRGFIYLDKLGDKVNGCADWKTACKLGNCGNYNLAQQKWACE